MPPSPDQSHISAASFSLVDTHTCSRAWPLRILDKLDIQIHFPKDTLICRAWSNAWIIGSLPLRLLQNTCWQALQNTTWTSALAISQCPIQQGKGSVTHTLRSWAGAVGLGRRLVHEMQPHKAIVLVFHIYPFFAPLQGTIDSLKDRQKRKKLCCYAAGRGGEVQRCSPKCKPQKMCTMSCASAAVESTIYTFLFNSKYKATGMKSKMKNRFSCRCCQTGSTTAPAAVSRRQERKGHWSNKWEGGIQRRAAIHSTSPSKPQTSLHAIASVQKLSAIYVEKQVALHPRQDERQTMLKGKLHCIQGKMKGKPTLSCSHRRAGSTTSSWLSGRGRPWFHISRIVKGCLHRANRYNTSSCIIAVASH